MLSSFNRMCVHIYVQKIELTKKINNNNKKKTILFPNNFGNFPMETNFFRFNWLNINFSYKDFFIQILN